VPESDREKWNARFREQRELSPPSPFLLELGPLLPRRGRALDVAGGAGRHAIWLARRGLEVTLVDISDVALEIAQRQAEAAGVALRTSRADLEVDPLPAGPWELIACVNYLQRSLFPPLVTGLSPGGLLVMEHPTRSNLARNPHPPAPRLLEDGELPALVVGLEIVRYEERWFETGRHEARLVARAPSLPASPHAGERA
jgi:SAM-dependent methyltransferase